MYLFDFFRKRKKIPEPWAKYYKSEELNIDIPDISMYEQIKKSSLKYPKYLAYQYYDHKVTYQKFIKEIDMTALAFKNLGINEKDIITICLPNIPEVLITLYALNKIGAIANMLHPLSSPEEIKKSLNSTNSRYLVMLDNFYDKIVDIINNTAVKKVIFTKASNYMPPFMKLFYNLTQIRKFKNHPKSSMFLDWFNFLKVYSKNSNVEFPVVGKDTPAVIIHSGGTSGKPKNVVIQNRAFILGSIQAKIILKNLQTGDSCLAIMPNFHGFGLSVCMHTPLSLGCKVILIPKFDAKKFDILFNKTKPNCVLGVPTLFEALTEYSNIRKLDLHQLKYVISGGDVLPQKLEKKVNDYLRLHKSLAHITQGYGLSESLAVVAVGVDDVNKSGSVGIPLPGNHIKIINQATRETVPYGEIGEICIHSKAFMSGYLNEESETNTALQVHKDGHIWLHTGDLGYMDEDGFVFYKGREKRLIVTSGYNVYPSYIEEIIEEHPAVLQCSVVGVPHPYKQEVPKAFIVLKDGYHTFFVKANIKEYCQKRLTKYMIPHEFVYRKKLPKTKLGKIDFKLLQEDKGTDDDE